MEAKMTHLAVAAAIVVGVALMPFVARSDSIENSKHTFEVIIQFQDSTCGPLSPLEGNEQRLSTRAELSIATLIRQFFGISGSTEVEQTKYKGVAQQQLLNLLVKGQECRSAAASTALTVIRELSPNIFNALNDALSERFSSARYEVWGTVTIPDAEGRRILLPRTAESIYGCSDEPARVGVVCLKDANYVDKKYSFPPDPGFHWDPAKIEFQELEGFGRTGGISYSVINGVIVVGAWVRSDPPNKAKASLVAYEYRNDPSDKFVKISEGTLGPSSDLAVALQGAKDWQVRIAFPGTERRPLRERIVTSESPDSLVPFLHVERLSNGQIILKTTAQAPPL